MTVQLKLGLTIYHGLYLVQGNLDQHNYPQILEENLLPLTQKHSTTILYINSKMHTHTELSQYGIF